MIFGFRAGNEHGPRDLEVQPPELLPPDDVGGRLPAHASFGQNLVAFGEPRGSPAAELVRNRSVVQPGTCSARIRASR